ncbi:hypothetical protein [Clostridium botulinum]|uniref:Uncharacterized protein n=1 Tax=Clostridium botulinum TaxID=1491 RepID=A0A6G4EI28_CLOBO|nr:hypothetical protein [Clostridium botulinum]APH19293.1 hypothetical protein NPD3_1333 [Clostridium botulinum]AUM92203.1 hypothetical protein RSJ5_13295 [Clostridium botulinum]NFB12579.1 hypothetical protein [Clostridium botulinum]NFH59492.1 hypothetical protein [Clostridium botulinum]NFH62818.1 hypothetical protein [Clostridium botulinum]
MSKKILIVRSANEIVIKKLINYIIVTNENNIELYCLVQKNSVKLVKNIYPNIQCFIINEDNFNYNQFKKNKNLINEINENKYDEIYIPSSYLYLNNFNDIFNIANSINRINIFTFTADGNITRIKFNKLNLKLNLLFGEYIYFFILVFKIVFLSISYSLKMLLSLVLYIHRRVKYK